MPARKRVFITGEWWLRHARSTPCRRFGGISANLLVRAADVVLQERRKLILMVRETPFTWDIYGQWRARGNGSIIGRLCRRSITNPNSARYCRTRVTGWLDLLGLPEADAKRWDGRSRRAEGNRIERRAFSVWKIKGR